MYRKSSIDSPNKETYDSGTALSIVLNCTHLNTGFEHFNALKLMQSAQIARFIIQYSCATGSIVYRIHQLRCYIVTENFCKVYFHKYNINRTCTVPFPGNVFVTRIPITGTKAERQTPYLVCSVQFEKSASTAARYSSLFFAFRIFFSSFSQSSKDHFK